MAARGVVLIGALGFLFTGCGSGETDATSECGPDSLDVPAPLIVVGDGEEPMDLVFVRGCGTEADGATGIGADPVVVSGTDEIRVTTSDDYDVRYALGPVGSPVSGFDGADAEFAIDVPQDGCHLLTVELDDGVAEARYAAWVGSTEAACAAKT